MNKKFLVILLTLVLCLFIVGCGSDSENPDTPDEPKPTLELTEKEVTLTVGETYEIKPVVKNLDGNDLVKYAVKDNTLLSIENNKITALKAGSTNVEITLKDYPEVKENLSVIIKDVPVISITGEKEVNVGETVTLKADLKNIEGTIEWKSSNEEIATVDTNGVVTGISEGTVEISAKCGELETKHEIKVNKVNVNITIAGSSTVFIGRETTLTATAENIADAEFVWESDDEKIASVDENGVVTGKKLGKVNIIATYGEFSELFEVTVVDGRIVVEGENSFKVGDTINLKATFNVKYDSSNTVVLDDIEFTWVSSDENIATVDENGVVTGNNAGKLTITVSYDGFSEEFEIIVMSIVISGPKEVYVGEQIILKAEVKGNSNVLDSELEWASSEDDVATVNGGVVTAKSEGTITITVSWNGLEAKYEITISLKKEVNVIGNSKVDLGETTTLQLSTLNVNGNATWKSSDESIATVDENGVVTTLALGKVTITATVDGVSGSLEIEVMPVKDKITYMYEGGSSKELYQAEEEITSMTLTSYNGGFWGGYTNNVFIYTKASDPKPTFSDRIYIGKNQYTGYYEVKGIIQSGPSSWADGAEYVIIISNSHNDSKTHVQKTKKLSIGDVVIIDSENITLINSANNAKVGFYKPEVSGDIVVVEKENYQGSLIEPVRLGFEFMGWYNAEGQKVESLNTEDINGNVKLTAKWSELNPVTELVINDIPLEMVTGETFKIEASVLPNDAFFKQVLFTTTDKDIISVTEDGLLTAINTGVATITVQDFMGKIVKTYEITVYAIPSIDVKFADDYTGVLKVSETLQLEPSYLGKTVDDLSFTFESNAPSIATVDGSGLITAVSNGNAVITIKSSNGKELQIGVTVNGLTETDKVDEVLNLLVDNAFAEVEVGNACLYNDSTTRYYRETYGSVNRFLFDDLDIDSKYAATAEANKGGHKDRRFSGGFNDSIEFVTVHDTATLTGTSESIASNMASGGTSIHYSTGNYKVWEVVPEKYIAYHAGDGTGTPFKWIATGVKTSENEAPEYDITQVNGTWYFVLNGQISNVVCPISNGEKTIANPSKEHLSHLGPVWKIVNGEYYIGNTWVCFSQVAAGVIGSFGGNNNSIGIEMSVNTTNDMYDTYQRTAKLVADILIRNNLDLTRVKQHNTWTGKNCPQVLIAGNYWNEFMKMVEIEYIIAKDYSDVTITMTPDNTDIIDETGRVKNAPEVATTVGYTITVSSGSVTKSIKLYSVIPGTTSWQKWNGVYASSLIWNNGNFVVNK